MTREIGRIVKRSLDEGRSVDIEGLGVFHPKRNGGFQFLPCTRPRVFLAYVEEDFARVRRLYKALAQAGFDPWLDKVKLLPGQNWPRAIRRAIGISDFFVACFSARAAAKRGTFQSELHFALNCAMRMPMDDIFIIPVRFEPCAVPENIARQIQYVDLFPDWNRGAQQIVRSIRRHVRTPRPGLQLAG